ncbi:hypothetical protein BDV93DRAFT_528143 [Ceratobasidium sp. AG-I]|nr:hypothetical protein BDV93DRAFT_528143 [Ceratobasidium sp. AG-I]
MIRFSSLLFFSVHCAALPFNLPQTQASIHNEPFSHNITGFVHETSDSQLHRGKDGVSFCPLRPASPLASRAIYIVFALIIVIAVGLGLLITVSYWRSSQAATPGSECDPLLGSQTADPPTVGRPTLSPLIILAGQGSAAVAPGGLGQATTLPYGPFCAQSPTNDLPPMKETHWSGSPSASARAQGFSFRWRPFACNPCDVPLPASPLDDTIGRNPRKSMMEAVLAQMRSPKALSVPNPSHIPQGLTSLKHYFISLLAIGASQGSNSTGVLRAPERNIKWLRGFFKDQPGVSFKSLLDQQATHASIKKTFREMYMSAHNNTLVVLYHTGHGDYDNALDLHAPGEVITEFLLDEWIKEFRQEARKEGPLKNIKVLIIFDFCRVNPSHPPADLSPDVFCIWAASPGELAVGLDLDPNLPPSLFLNALLVAVHDVQFSPGAFSFRFLEARLQQMQRTARGILCLMHRCMPPWRICGCEHCRSGRCCAHDAHPSVDQSSSSSVLDEDIDAAALIKDIMDRFPWRIQQAAQLLRTNPWFLEFNPTEGRREARALMFGIWLPSRKMEVAVRSFTHPCSRRRDSEIESQP